MSKVTIEVYTSLKDELRFSQIEVEAKNTDIFPPVSGG